MTDRRAEEMPLLVRHLQEPARPTARIAAGVPVGQIANDGKCSGAPGRSIGQLAPLLVRHLAATEGKMEKIARHGPSSLVHAQTAEEPLCSAGETRIPRLRVSVEILTSPRRYPGGTGAQCAQRSVPLHRADLTTFSRVPRWVRHKTQKPDRASSVNRGHNCSPCVPSWPPSPASGLFVDGRARRARLSLR